MICIDNQPFNIVENKGFTNLDKTLEPDYVIPGRKYFSDMVTGEVGDGPTRRYGGGFSLANFNFYCLVKSATYFSSNFNINQYNATQ